MLFSPFVLHNSKRERGKEKNCKNVSDSIKREKKDYIKGKKRQESDECKYSKGVVVF